MNQLTADGLNSGHDPARRIGLPRMCADRRARDMISIPRIALTGLNASLAQLGSAAHNIANANTQRFHRQEVALAADPQGGVAFTTTQAPIAGSSLERDVLSQLVAKNAFMANLAVFRTADDMAGTLLSIHS